MFTCFSSAEPIVARCAIVLRIFSFLCHKAPPFPDVSTSDVSGSGRGLTTKTRYEQQTDRVIGKCSSLARYARERGDDFHLINMKKKNNNIKQTDRHNLAVICVY